MKKFIKKYKILLSLIFLFLIMIINFNEVRSFARSKLSDNHKILIKEIFFGKEYLQEISFYRKLGYNRFEIPKTQFIDLEFKKITLEGLKSSKTRYNIGLVKAKTKKFFLEDLGDGILIASALGEFNFSTDYSFSDFKRIDTNLSEFNIFQVVDISKIENEVFVSFAIKGENSECIYLGIANANINKDELLFDLLYKGDECTYETNGLGGRIYPYIFKEKKGFLLTTAATGKMKKKSQDVKSFFGKIWFFELATKNKILFSTGHRNPQGLLVVDDIIISTEHGPYGGDEINNIKFGKNYGYPISSYGEFYKFKKDKEKLKIPKYELSKSHLDNNFEEPIFSFVPSIGISEIEKISNNFSEYWIDNFLVTSLNGRTVYRIKFDNKFEKVIYMEPMYLGERIRDIKYIKNKNIIVLALEETGSIGVLSTKKFN
tara:strand:- start:18458 stop:19750 length:1293 start_codon:yes stop_codon:yes gene_type:complete